MIRACFPFAASTAIGYYRLALPAMALSHDGQPVKLFDGTLVSPEQIAMLDHREAVKTALVAGCTPYHLGTLAQVRRLKDVGYAVLIDLDDNAWDYEKRKPEQIEELDAVLKLVDRVVTTCPFLRNKITERTGVEAVLLRNTLPVRSFFPPQRRRDSRLRVLYTGAFTHDTEWPLLAKLIRKTSEFCDWIMYMGDGRDPDGNFLCHVKPPSLNGLPVTWHIPQRAAHFMDHAHAVRPDVTVAPLDLTGTNRAKSDLKLLEAGALGVPCIASRLAPYEASPNFTAPDSAAFVKELRRMAGDEYYRLEQAEKMATFAWERRLEGETYCKEVRQAWTLT